MSGLMHVVFHLSAPPFRPEAMNSPIVRSMSVRGDGVVVVGLGASRRGSERDR